MKFNQLNYLTFPFKIGMEVRSKINKFNGTIIEFYSNCPWHIAVKMKNFPYNSIFPSEELEIIK